MAENPYAAPKTHVEDVAEPLPEGNFIPTGRGVQGGNGWRWFTDAWTLMAGQRWTFVGVFVLLMLLQIFVQLIPILGPIAVSFLYPFLIGGFLIGCDAVRRGGRLEVGHLFAAFQSHSSKLLLLGALTFAMSIVLGIVMLLFLGASFGAMFLSGAEPDPEQLMAMGPMFLLGMLVVLALSVPVTMAVLFAPALIVFRDFDAVTAIKSSFIGCLKNVVPFLVWGVMGFLLAIAASIPLFLGWFILAPVMMVSLFVAYRDIYYEA